MRHPYSTIAIIYNPKSTGDSKQMAYGLRKILRRDEGITMPVDCIPTKYAGHAEVLAEKLASKHERPLIISSSGDGGYNEVVNGIMNAINKKQARHPIAAVLPAGNANDHSRTLQDDPLHKAILSGRVTKIDLLRVDITSEDTAAQAGLTRYAHSYAGVGITPVVAAELNRHTLNAFNQLGFVIKTFWKYRPFKILRRGRTVRLDSLLFMNINQMAKIFKLAPDLTPDDGQFDVVHLPHKHKFQLLKMIITAATIGLSTTTQQTEYEFTALKKMPMQLDGELVIIKGGSHVRITSAHKALTTII
ncbi:diacylglycerol kinase [Candidatus Saccharibacteria bacterium]|nr:diacylglycerol kinase [Candidatus Saccharibacteria bacterium]